MRQTDIQAELMRLFNEAGDAGRVVVWHDPDGEFAESVEELELPGIELMVERENELFSLKQALNEDLAGRRILLYRPRERHLEGDWLADVEVRSTPFSADYASIQLRELGAADTPEMRSELKARKRWLSKRSNVRRLLALRDSFAVPQELELAIMAVALGAPAAEPVPVLVSYLIAAREQAGIEALAPLEAAGVADSLRAAVRAWTGFSAEVTDAAALVQHVLLSAFTRTAPADKLAGLERCCSPDHADLCNEVFRAWLASGERASLLDVCVEVEGACKLEDRLAEAALPELLTMGVFPCVDAVILRRLFSAVCDPSSSEDVLAAVGARRGLAWYEELSCYYGGVTQAARMRRFWREHPEGLAAMPAERVWEAYEQEWYQMDTWYRAFHQAFAGAIRSGEYELDEDFRVARAAMENLYKGWFLRMLSERWAKAAEAELASQGYVSGVPRQQDFFMSEVEGLAQGKRRAWVIVSDALRYEVATELADVLERETKGSAELASVQATLPSITKCGMPALLPHGSFSLERGQVGGKTVLSVLVDGVEAVTCAKRQEVIRCAYPTGAAVTYDDFVNGMGRAERKELVGEADVVYVYHNAIDATGDKAATERKVFDACADAVEEISGLVKLIVREFRATDVLVTADHGFLYTDEPLAASDHVSLKDVSGEVVEAGRRYVVAEPSASSEVLLPVALPGDHLRALMPRECVRIAMAGGGENYVHGGISLQEMCVPVLRFRNRRAGSKGYVESAPVSLSLVSTLDTITNSLFSLELLQDEPAGGKALPAEYEVFVGNAAHEPVTDVAHVVADRASADASERTFAVRLSLRPGFSPGEGERYPLLARNVGTGEVSVLRELRMQVAFVPSIDFGW